ncbi:MAG TPA: sigma-54 dependent transcriptional regulator [Acidobacteriota bacterium]|nr:sigma-54 dependent transcriptional regulator [Acidobacteriota bacterium]
MRQRSNTASLLVVDDAPDTLEILKRTLSAEGFRVYTAPGVHEAITLMESTPIDLVITDLKMPKVSGLDLVRHVRENVPDAEVMMITGYANIESAVEAVKTGAEEYLAKPFTDEELLTAVNRALSKLQQRRVARPELKQPLVGAHGIIGESDAVHAVDRAVAKAASTSATVLISGESGTGKELVARAIHYSSARASAPFVAVNCGAIPSELVESELFGHVKGAFTGAIESRAGFFQAADGGTVFLDEISETSLAAQVKLLRVLEDKEISMVGAARTRKVDVRILAATNKDLSLLVKKGLFREDLFFRLSVITVAIPALRERGNDILLIANHFVSKCAEEMDKPLPKLSDRVLKVLMGYAWPGNVRELENLMQRLVVMTDGPVINVSDLPTLMRYRIPRENGLNRTLAEMEADYIQSVLASVDGNKTKAAEILGIDRKTLREKLKTFTTT